MTLSRKNRKLVAGQIVAVICATANSSLHAGQPLVTDDASIVAPGTCQLEAWWHPHRDGHEYWAQPACNFTGNQVHAISRLKSSTRRQFSITLSIEAGRSRLKEA